MELSDFEDRKLAEAVRAHVWEGHCYCLSDYNCYAPSCIACANHQEEGHRRDCWLAPLLISNGPDA